MRQSVARKDSFKQAAQARRLLSHVTLSSNVCYFTIEDEAGTDGQACAYRLAAKSFQVGYLMVEAMQAYYLIPCGRTGRYYVVTQVDGEWVSSCKDVRPDHIAKVMEYRTVAVLPDEEAQAVRMAEVQASMRTWKETMTDAEREALLRDSLAYDCGGDAYLVEKFLAPPDRSFSEAVEALLDEQYASDPRQAA